MDGRGDGRISEELGESKLFPYIVWEKYKRKIEKINYKTKAWWLSSPAGRSSADRLA